MTPEHRFDWGSFGQLLVGLAGFLFGLGGAGLLALIAMLQRSAGGEQLKSLMALAWGGLLIAGLCLPSIVLAVRSLMGLAPVMRNGLKALIFANLLLLLWPLALVLSRATVAGSMSWLFLPPLLIAVMGIPVLWLTCAARSGLPAESLQRSWGVASFGLAISPMLILGLQLLVMVAGIIGFGVWLTGQPALLSELEMLTQAMTLQTDPNRVLELMRPYLHHPWVLAAGIFFFSGLVPLMEELLKPLGVWFLAGRRITPAAGFSAGVLSGGMFALLESLGYLSNSSPDDFILFALARTSTVMLHVATTGLVGWGLGSALGEKRYLRLALAYLGAVFLHGTWNAIGVLPTLAEVSGFAGPLQGLETISPFLLGGLALFMAVMLIVLNRRLRAPAVVTAPDSHL